jgi:hypothetical protein
MYYKFLYEEWLTGNEVFYPDGKVLNSENKENYDGWEWHDVAPVEYTKWLNNEN